MEKIPEKKFNLKKVAKKTLVAGLTVATVGGAMDKNALADVPANDKDNAKETKKVLKIDEIELPNITVQEKEAIEKAKEDLKNVQQRNKLAKAFRDEEMTVEEIVEQCIYLDDKFDGLLKWNKELTPQVVLDDLEKNPLLVTMKYFKNGKVVNVQRGELTDEKIFGAGDLDYDERTYSISRKVVSLKVNSLKKNEIENNDSELKKSSENNGLFDAYKKEMGQATKSAENLEKKLTKEDVKLGIINVLDNTYDVTDYRDEIFNKYEKESDYRKIIKMRIDTILEKNKLLKVSIVQGYYFLYVNEKKIYAGRGIEKLYEALNNNLSGEFSDYEKEEQCREELYREYYEDTIEIIKSHGFSIEKREDKYYEAYFSKDGVHFEMKLFFSSFSDDIVFEFADKEINFNYNDYKKGINEFMDNIAEWEILELRDLREEYYDNIIEILTENDCTIKYKKNYAGFARSSFDIFILKEGIKKSISVNVKIKSEEDVVINIVFDYEKRVECTKDNYEKELEVFLNKL